MERSPSPAPGDKRKPPPEDRDAAGAAPAARRARPPPAPRIPRTAPEELSHGQRPPSDARRPDRGLPLAPVAQGELPPPAPPARLLLPGHAAWFRYGAVHRLEREALPEWFDGRAEGKGDAVRETSARRGAGKDRPPRLPRPRSPPHLHSPTWSSAT
jgi:hypothetical protein